MRGAWEGNLLGEYGSVHGGGLHVLETVWVSCVYGALRKVIELRLSQGT